MRWKVTVGTTAVLIIAIAVAALSAAGLLRRALESDAEDTLRGRIDEVQLLIEDGPLPEVLTQTVRLVGLVQVTDASGQVVARTAGAAAPTVLTTVLPPPPVGERASTTVDGAAVGRQSDSQYLVMAHTVPSPDGPMTVYVATTVVAIRAERYLRGSLLLSLPVLIGLAALLTSQVVRRALAPVEAMRVEVDRIEASDLSGRVETGTDEVGRLGLTLNRMLDRLEDAGKRQQLFSASASHELRSPLSAIRTELEVARAYADQTDWDQVAEDVLTEVARLERLSQDLRVFTRPGWAAHGEAFDLGDLLDEEVARRRSASTLDYRSTTEPAVVHADRDTVLRVVRNLLDNAERHAASAVAVDLHPRGGGTSLVISNDGEPIPVEQLEEVFEPFTRLDEARALDARGSGLGLAIARSIMASAGGTLRARETRAGASFEAWFPAPPAPA